MSTSSLHLSLPYIQASQAQKHVTHNEALRRLDGLVQISVIAGDVSAPPATPAAGDRYVVGASASGDWAGRDYAIASWDETAWQFLTPHTGWQIWDQAAGRAKTWSGAEWEFLAPPADLQNLDHVGVGTTADDTNPLAVSGPASLLTHAGTGGHQVKVNKAAQTDTSSLLFQTNWAGRAEMGTMGSDDFEIKVSADGSTFYSAIKVDHSTGIVSFPNTDFGGSDFGDGELVTVDYSAAKGLDLVVNGTGLLGNAYNFPGSDFNAQNTPNLPGAFVYSGHYTGERTCEEFLPVDPNQVYRLSCYLRQPSVSGDWSAFSNGERHTHYMGIAAYDIDQNAISANTHMRYRQGGVDSKTTLTAPLSPGDTVVELADASGWNDSATSSVFRGLIIFGYRNSQGTLYKDYSRLVQYNMFDLAGVDKAQNQITLSAPLPASMGNPDDPNGTWPIGTPLANTSSGGTYKYSVFSAKVLPSVDDWYLATNHMGGIDRSGSNVAHNFPPGTAYVKVLWLPNYSNRSGGFYGHPDTGDDGQLFVAGVSVVAEPLATKTRAADDSVTLNVPRSNVDTGQISLGPRALTLNLV